MLGLQTPSCKELANSLRPFPVKQCWGQSQVSLPILNSWNRIRALESVGDMFGGNVNLYFGRNKECMQSRRSLNCNFKKYVNMSPSLVRRGIPKLGRAKSSQSQVRNEASCCSLPVFIEGMVVIIPILLWIYTCDKVLPSFFSNFYQTQPNNADWGSILIIILHIRTPGLRSCG